MKERLFELEEEIDLTKLENIINDEVRDDIKNHENDVNADKWGLFPVVYLEKESTINKIKEFISFVDDIDLSILEKIDLILTLIYLVEKAKFDINSIDINNIYLLVNYLNNEEISNLKERLDLINDDEILYQIRCFSLDISIREKLLDYFLKNDLSKEQLNEMITENDYYSVVDII